jgi:hypothetical protein
MSFPSIFDYCPKTAAVLWKEAAEEEPSSGFLPIFAGSALGAAGGWAAGRGVGHLLDGISQQRTGNPIKARNLLIPGAIVGALAGHAYAEHRKKEVEELRRVASNYRNRRSGGASGE